MRLFKSPANFFIPSFSKLSRASLTLLQAMVDPSVSAGAVQSIDASASTDAPTPQPQPVTGVQADASSQKSSAPAAQLVVPLVVLGIALLV